MSQEIAMVGVGRNPRGSSLVARGLRRISDGDDLDRIACLCPVKVSAANQTKADQANRETSGRSHP